MKIIILAVGKEKDFSGQDIVREYVDRLTHYSPCEFKYISGTDKVEDNKKILDILNKEKTGAYVVALDEIGKEFDSSGFSEFLQKKLNESVRTLFFVIGGSYGLSDEVRKCANITVALSKLTFPHQLVRLILVEQLYRAFSIIRGEKYHH